MRYYKVLSPDGRPHNGGTGQWHLPHGKRPGKWMPRIDRLVPRRLGYHVCRRGQLVRWLGPEIYVCEIDGDTVRQDAKIVVARARLLYRVRSWDDRARRLFACDCAERVLRLFERKYPGDSRPRAAIEVARRYAEGNASIAELRAAGTHARVAARIAVLAARSAAASAAERTWQTARLFTKYLDTAPP